MDIPIERRGDTIVVRAPESLVHENRQELKQHVVDEVERGERKFVIDFARTTYIDSAGLGVLVSLYKKVRDQGGELRLANLNDDLQRLFELTKLETLFSHQLRLGDDVEGEGNAGRTAPRPPRPSGPLHGAAEADLPDERPPV